MSASPESVTGGDTVGGQIGLGEPSADAWLSPDAIIRNPDNPRLIFDRKRLDELKQSIYEVGILQPLVVYRQEADPDTYMLIDGERRRRCALELNMARVPVLIHPQPTRIQNITMMFNIHKLRVDWERMPSALKLKELMDLTSVTSTAELARMTGQSVGAVQASKKLLFYSDRHQRMLLHHEIKDNFLIELYPFIVALRRRFPNLFDEYGTDTIVDLLIEKERRGIIKAVTEFRELVKTIRAVDKGAPEETVRKAVRRVLDEPEYDIASAYASVRAVFDVEELTARCSKLAMDISEFEGRGLDSDSIAELYQAIERLSRALRETLGALNRHA